MLISSFVIIIMMNTVKSFLLFQLPQHIWLVVRRWSLWITPRSVDDDSLLRACWDTSNSYPFNYFLLLSEHWQKVRRSNRTSVWIFSRWGKGDLSIMRFTWRSWRIYLIRNKFVGRQMFIVQQKPHENKL